ncbi:MAG: Gfo/Idh/MocA family oxidoreductase [Kiritimatiellae bacterium]|jgi:predicted dehydrogenase|nr:Gfo/Idh/MocA family oxidoreductase [Kiritimatiellia bacterium]
MNSSFTRRNFFKGAMIGAGIAAIGSHAAEKVPVIQGFDETDAGNVSKDAWKPVSDRKIKVGIAGFGVCQFGAQFGFQNHPNVEVVAATDLFPDRCAELAKRVGAKKTYASCEEMFEKDKEIEAVFIATDAPSHARLCIAGLKRGLHMATAVPAVFGDDQLELADELLATVKKTGLTYAMFETSSYHADNYAMHQIYKAGGFGKLIYSEGEYYHYGNPTKGLGSYKNWRHGLPPQWYPTHSNAYYTCVTLGSFISVSCMGMPSIQERRMPKNNAYKNPYGSEIALFRTNEGGMSRMNVCWDMPGTGGEQGRIYGQKASFVGRYSGKVDVTKVNVAKPPLPPGMPAGAHGGSEGYLADDFINAILLKRKPRVDVACALNTTVPGIIAHQSAMKDGETLKIPQYQV